MSRVTNAILTTHVSEGAEQINSVNRFLRETEGGGYGEFIDVTQFAGGCKHLECNVYLSAFNHADTEVIVRAVDQAPWKDREMVQLLIKEQAEETFSLRYNGASSQ